MSTDWLEEHLGDPDLVVVDMRWREDGSARSLYEAGHIPGARFLDWSIDLVAAGVPPGSRAITYCGCGISASALLFALNLSGVEDASLYDASWEEWGRDASRPVARD